MAGTDLSLPLVSLCLTTLTYVLYQLSKMIYGELTSPWRHLPGPKNPSLVFGNFKDILNDVCAPIIHRLT